MRAFLLALGLTVCSSVTALAEQTPEEHGAAHDLSADGPLAEPVDRTRLDVARLPPEAATITRDDYDRGVFLEAQLGALTYVGDARAVSRAGPRLAVTLGYELTRWLALVLALDASMHMTKNRPPPSHTSFELLGASLGVRLTVPIDVQHAIWAAGLAGVAWSSGDVLRGLGFEDAFKPGVSYGGELGYDYHLRSRHHSVGVLGGAKLLPTLADDAFTLAAYGAGYLRYVF
jgi:hypothetical protein